jgi:hypothetical protein
MFALTRPNAYDAICPDDLLRRNAIAFCLREWGLIEVDDIAIEPHNKFIFVLQFAEKADWKISHKFNLKSLNDKID